MLMMMMIAATSPHHQLLVDRVSEGGRQQGGGEQGEHQEQTNLQVIANSWTLPKAQLGPKALSTVTHLTPLVQSRSFVKFWNLGQTSAESCLAEICLDLFCLSNLSLVLFGKGREIYRKQIHGATLTNPCTSEEKSNSILTNPCKNLEKSMFQFLPTI